MIIRPKVNQFAILFTLKGSIAKRIAMRTLMVTLLASAIVLVEILHPSNFTKVNATPFTLLGLSLSIFMNFRNNACYDRWYEARKAWGEVIVHIRSVIRETHVIRESAERKPLLLNLCGFAHALNARLRKESEADASSQWIMPKPDPQTPDYSGRICRRSASSVPICIRTVS
jgi:putative membrane protein